MADLTPDLQVCLSWGLIAGNFHSQQSLSVSCFQVIFGLPGSCFPSTCRSKTVLTAPLECSTCPYQRSLLSFRMRSKSSLPSRASSSLDLVVTMSCCLTLQICLIIALSFCCRCWRFGFVSRQVSLAWSIALRTQELYTIKPKSKKKKKKKKKEEAGAIWSGSALFVYALLSETLVYEILGYLPCAVEAPQQGAFNEGPQYMFSWRNKKDTNTFCLKKGTSSEYIVSRYVHISWDTMIWPFRNASSTYLESIWIARFSNILANEE